MHRVDLSDAVLDILAWGGDPAVVRVVRSAGRRIAWTPRSRCFEQLGAVRDGKVTALGARMKRLPLHPRLARMLIESGGRRDVALACALLSERRAAPRQPATTESDLLSAVGDERLIAAARS